MDESLPLRSGLAAFVAVVGAVGYYQFERLQADKERAPPAPDNNSISPTVFARKRGDSSLPSRESLQELASVYIGDVDFSDENGTQFREAILLRESEELARELFVSTARMTPALKSLQLLKRSPSMEVLDNALSQKAALPARNLGAKNLPVEFRKHYATLENYDLDPRNHSDKELMEFAVAIFYCYDVPDRMGIPLASLCNFVQVVHDSYKPPEEVVFHNFKHVYNVLHICFHMLRLGLEESLTTFEVFALFVTALCHDIDHPGVNNAFMISSKSEIAGLYSNDAVLERHHSYVTRKILRSGPDSIPCHDIMCGMNEAYRLRFKQLVSSAILATDMSHHMDKVKVVQDRSKRNKPFDAENETDRLDLLCILLHTADIGAQTHATELALRWGHTVSEEFSAQYQKEIEMGLPPSPFMADLDDEFKFSLMQAGFISNIVLPLWTGVADCFPGLKPRVAMLNRNKEAHQEVLKNGPSSPGRNPPSS